MFSIITVTFQMKPSIHNRQSNNNNKYMNISFKALIKTIRSLQISPSQEWHEKTLNKIRALQEGEIAPKQFSFFNLFAMQKIFSGVIAIAIVAVSTGYIYTQNTPYAKAQGHLQAMTEALEKLQQLSQGAAISLAPSLFPTAYAEDPAAIETKATQLIQEIDQENEAVIENADEIENLEDVADLLEELDKIQQEVVDALANVIEKTDNEKLIKTATVVINNAIASNEVIQDTLKETTAIGKNKDNHKNKVKTELVKKVNEKKQERQSSKTEGAEEILKGLDMKVEDMTPPMQSKYQKIQDILKTCKDKEEKCQAGKAQGLATALESKTRNEIRKASHDENNPNEDKEDKIKTEDKNIYKQNSEDSQKNLDQKDIKNSTGIDKQEIEDVEEQIKPEPKNETLKENTDNQDQKDINTEEDNQNSEENQEESFNSEDEISQNEGQ